MADIRCQMCGKTNPGHLDECRHCGARLKPLVASSGPKPEESGSNWADASPEDTLGWLRSLGQDEGSSGKAQDDLPDWLNETPPTETGRKTSDWMDEFEQESGLDSNAGTSASPWASRTEDKLDQWLPVEDDTPFEASDDNLDSFLGGKETGQGAGTFLWDTNREDEKTVPLSEHVGNSLDNEEDWLKSLDDDESLTATVVDWEPENPPAQDAKETLPDWLTAAPADLPYPAADDFDDDLPSWLKKGDSTTPSSEPITSSSDQFDGDFPDWLESLSSKTGMTGKLDDMPEWIDEQNPSDSQKDPSLDWLATLGDTPEEEPEEEAWAPGAGSVLGKDAMGGLTLDPEDSFISEVGKDETPNWLQGMQEPETDYTAPASDFSSFQSNWGFTSRSSTESRSESRTGREAEEGTPLEDSGITGGLRSMFMAFSPMDGADIASEHVEGELERVGPLAGLRDLLTPEADITKTSKPPSYSDVLQVSSTQQTNTQLLQALVESENIPQTIPDASPLSSPRIMRIVFGVLLILLMIFPLFSGTEIIPLPQTLPQEIQNLENLSNSAPLDRPILVAFDYEPGLSGELEVASRALFDQWMERGIPLALVSTSPVGSALGERQVTYIQSRVPYQHHYVYGEDYVNLGYIAGGTAGLANFALTPRQTVRMAFDDRPIWELLDLDASNPWLTPVMQPITGLGDFYMTVLLTDNPETARNWLEQVEPILRRNSFVVIASTQAEPFIRPYFQNPEPSQRQVEGMLVGLRGGAAYEQNLGQLGTARFYWDTFGIGLLVAVILIILGGGYNYLDEMRRVQRQSRRGKSKK